MFDLNGLRAWSNTWVLLWRKMHVTDYVYLLDVKLSIEHMWYYTYYHLELLNIYTCWVVKVWNPSDWGIYMRFNVDSKLFTNWKINIGLYGCGLYVWCCVWNIRKVCQYSFMLKLVGLMCHDLQHCYVLSSVVVGDFQDICVVILVGSFT